MRDQGSYVDQDHITSQRHAFENVIQNQVLNVNQDHIQPRQALEDSHQEKVLNDKQDHVQPETIISQPDIDYITTMTSDDDDNDIQNVDDEQIMSAASHEFKANRLSSLQLKTARAMLDQEFSELEHKSVQEMLLNPNATTTSYADHYEERDFLSPLYLSSFIISSPGCYDKYKCKACDREYTQRQTFRVHHRSRLHLNNFHDWIKNKEQGNPVEPLNKKQKL